MSAAGPLSGIRVLEFAGMGPAPFATMLLSDLGAEVLRIDRAGLGARPREVVARGRASLSLDLKAPESVEVCRSLFERSDVVIEGFRPGVMERLGLGPDIAMNINPRLVYGRMTGWGQTGPLSRAAGHDINYIAITGALHALGPRDRPPTPPLNLVGDFGGGALYLVFGIVASLYERERSGKGQIIDAAIIDGASSMMAMSAWARADGFMGGRGENLLDGSAHYYRCYECSDGRYISVGSVEPHFYSMLREKSGIARDDFASQAPEFWESTGLAWERLFKTKTQAEWCALLEGTDACFAPVLDLADAPTHPQNAARGVFLEAFGVVQPAPAPRFSRTPGAIQGPPPAAGENGARRAAAWGVPARILEALPGGGDAVG